MATTVAILGLGKMGSAIAVSLVGMGPRLVVWNRTQAKTRPFRARSVRVARTVQEAVNASDVVLIVTSNVMDLDVQIGGTGVDVRRKQFVNLTTSMPYELRALKAYIESAGGGFLNGVVQCSAQEIGSPGAAITFSGDLSVWESRRTILKNLAPNATYVA
ncbi:NAD(P)-binding domain-containing protein [Cupriavidus pauculus]|uniref:NAD(P)-binding domain-containing protein n=1 Tax=Cupriavidus pauculus TaxID=82633 RepID=UPI003857B72A